jgi:hypothetical protein
MKTRKILILAIALSMSTLTFAERTGGIKSSTDTWLQRNDNGSLRSAGAAPTIGDETPTPDPTPIGNPGGWMLVLCMSYCGYVIIRKQQKTNA